MQNTPCCARRKTEGVKKAEFVKESELADAGIQLS